MIRIKQKGDFTKFDKFRMKVFKASPIKILEKYGRAGVEALASNTPKKTGLTASSWTYEIIQTDHGYSLTWNNTNVQKYVNIALILQYGHATGTGGYVEGIDYINPALRPIFEKLADEAWKEVTS